MVIFPGVLRLMKRTTRGRMVIVPGVLRLMKRYSRAPHGVPTVEVGPIPVYSEGNPEVDNDSLPPLKPIPDEEKVAVCISLNNAAAEPDADAHVAAAADDGFFADEPAADEEEESSDGSIDPTTAVVIEVFDNASDTIAVDDDTNNNNNTNAQQPSNGDAMPEPEPASCVAGEGGADPGDAMPELEPASCVAGEGGAEPNEGSSHATQLHYIAHLLQQGNNCLIVPLDDDKKNGDSDDEEEAAEDNEAAEEEYPLNTEESHATTEQDIDDAAIGQNFVKLLDGKTLTLGGATKKTKITDIKKLIIEKNGMPIKMQRLQHRGRKLVNGHSVSSRERTR